MNNAGQERMRLNRFLASSGFGSRRACEELIREGVITVNGVVTRALHETVMPAKDTVRVRGKTVRPVGRHVYLMMYKPKGYLTTMKDPQERKSVVSLLPKTGVRLFPVGRLDRDSEGLLLFTSDGEIAHGMAHPRYAVSRYYRVDLATPFPRELLPRLESGVMAGGERLRAHKAWLQGEKRHGHQIQLVLRTGRKREIRRLLAALRFDVVRILRYGFGPLRLGSLELGNTRRLTAQEIKELRGLMREA